MIFGDKKLKKQTYSLILIAFVAIGTIAPLVFADDALTFPRFEAIGRLDIVSSGVGLNGADSGTIGINVPLTSQVIAAYLYWGGYDTGASAGDNQVTFDDTLITADESYSDWWYDNKYNYIYVADVTPLVNLGYADYDIEEFGPLEKNYGAGLIVVYKDETLPLSRVIILEGLDSFWFDWLNPRGQNSEVTYLDFIKANDDRDMEITLIVGGTEHNDRPNEIWTKTGKGSKPINLVDPPSDAIGPYPLIGADGNAWDTFTNTVQIPKGDEWVGIQIESIESWESAGAENYEGRGDSAVLICSFYHSYGGFIERWAFFS